MKNDQTTGPLLQLTSTIASYVATLHAPQPEAQEPLASILESARHAGIKPPAAVENPYAGLVASAARSGLSGKAGSIARALLELDEPLPWVYHYPPRTPGEDLSDRIAFAELIGPDGPLWAPQCRVGFTVLDRHTLYPLHAHPAVELYLVIAGLAQWRTPGSDRRVPPGDLVLHRSNEPHEMRTDEEPLLALWGWTGDLDSPAVYL